MAKSSDNGGGSNDRTKLIVAIVALVAAAAILAYTFGAFDKFFSKPPVVPAPSKEDVEASKKAEDAAKNGPRPRVPG